MVTQHKGYEMEIQTTKDIKKKEKVHIALYGASGTGKTKMIETLKGKTLILNADKGLLTLKGSENVDFVNLNTFEDVIEAMKFIKSEKNNYDNIAIDSMSVIGDLLIKYLKGKGVKGFDLWGEYANYIGSIMMTSIFELIEKENESGLLAKKVGLQGSLSSRVGYFFDFFFAARLKQSKEGPIYKIQTQSKEGYECKSRLEGLDTFIEPDLGKLITQLRK
jgi:energy-coupling factor transporter ATP-binding protein EcfA2